MCVFVFVLSQDDHRDDRSLPGCFPEGGRHGNQHQRYVNKQTNRHKEWRPQSISLCYDLWVAHNKTCEKCMRVCLCERACSVISVKRIFFSPSNSLIFLELFFKIIYSDIIEKPLDFTKCWCVCVMFYGETRKDWAPCLKHTRKTAEPVFRVCFRSFFFLLYQDQQFSQCLRNSLFLSERFVFVLDSRTHLYLISNKAYSTVELLLGMFLFFFPGMRYYFVKR